MLCSQVELCLTHKHMTPDMRLCAQTGFLSAGKKSSMFSVPEGVESKVGVIGSGQGMTAQPSGTKHEFSLGM